MSEITSHYFTFGHGHVDNKGKSLLGAYVEVRAQDGCHRELFRRKWSTFNLPDPMAWSFEYSQAEWNETDPSHFPAGKIAVVVQGERAPKEPPETLTVGPYETAPVLWYGRGYGDGFYTFIAILNVSLEDKLTPLFVHWDPMIDSWVETDQLIKPRELDGQYIKDPAVQIMTKAFQGPKQ